MSNQTDTPKDTLADFTSQDFSKLTEALSHAAERTQPIIRDFFEKNTLENIGEMPLDPLNIRKTYLDYMMRMFQSPDKMVEMQMEFMTKWVDLWNNSMDRYLEGNKTDPIYKPEKGDRRFKAPVWQESSLFDFIKQSYLLTSESIMNSVYNLEDIDPHEKQKLEFYARQYVSAIAPSNFIMTNPEVIKATLESGGDNLVKGLENLLNDLERGRGDLAISTTDYKAFQVGENLATTAGKVVYQNDLMQLIQYEPRTEKVFKRPLLIIPPWINKYYILDLRPENSFIRWLVEQGHTVFVISWVNPTKELATKNFEDYMQEGCVAALDTIEKITGENTANVMGYCLGGTLLSAALAGLKKEGKDDRITSATFLTTLVDFEKAGDLKIFIDDEQIEIMEKKMAKQGYLEGEAIKKTFSMLRSTDLIWSFVVNNYLLGKEPFPFDLLYWNDDSTNMPAKMHSFYLRQMYRDNLLCKPNGLTLCGQKIDMRKVDTPSYFLSTKEDHIAPWKATYETTRLFSGHTMFTLAASGHIAGVVNPPAADKYCFYYNDKIAENPEDWLENAKEKPGSWWPHWQKWIKDFTGPKVDARKTGSKKYAPIEDAPGSYVKLRN